MRGPAGSSPLLSVAKKLCEQLFQISKGINTALRHTGCFLMLGGCRNSLEGSAGEVRGEAAAERGREGGLPLLTSTATFCIRSDVVLFSEIGRLLSPAAIVSVLCSCAAND